MQSELSKTGYDPQDAKNNKVVAALGYILFLIPLLLAKDSRFAMYHANQGLLLLIVSVIANFVLGLIPVIGWILLPIANLALLIMAILGIVRAVNGETKPLPFIGTYTLLK
ncbi:DUF4870 domain-containing protein [Paenibacillus rigui]|uniref:Import component protein n=1 Tax=Paenibacillus rigui TaxID=554312 RepID=A0A229UWK7_9BACL|nr:DUF4870 domain-containing protein [Paenibacillus rigui]OXM87750.1 hypothetical protein CF651_01115 [Paenibacillus rigui]